MNYYIVHNPQTFNLMDHIGEVSNPLELLSVLTGKDPSKLEQDNFRDYLSLDPKQRRITMVETFGVDSYATEYVANQITRVDKDSRVILTDGKRRTLEEVIRENGNPKAVFMTSMSANFPTTVSQTVVLNYGRIPVILGGIHVSTSPSDVDTFIRRSVPNPLLVSFVKGPGDSEVVRRVLEDLDNGSLREEYNGETSIEDGIWGNNRIDRMPAMKMDFLTKVPFFGRRIMDRFKINVATPYLGCPFSCKFCSVSSLPPDQRKFTSREPEDFVDELKVLQGGSSGLENRYFFFLPDNLLLGGKKLDRVLDAIIGSDLKINYFAQVSIDVADREELLKKLRLSGATHFFIGFESLNLQNLRHVNKQCVKAIEKSGLAVADYFSRQIRKIQDQGISINGSFIFGLPYDYFHSLSDNSSRDVSQFCIDNHIALQPNCLTDLPGSECFSESQANGSYLYGEQGSMEYLLSLPTCDFTETNRVPPDSLFKSPLVLVYMAYNAIDRVGSTRNAIRNALYMGRKAWKCPTRNGRKSLRERGMDFATAIISQLGTSLYREHAQVLANSNGTRGVFERLYDNEKDSYVRELFRDFVEEFR